LAAGYAVGALDGDDLAQFEAHLPTCPACQAAVRGAQETLARAVLSSPPQAPPAAARGALVRRVAERRDVRSYGWLRWAAATLVAAGAAGAGRQDLRAVDDRGQDPAPGGPPRRRRGRPGHPSRRCRGRARAGLRRHARARRRHAGADGTDRPRVEVARLPAPPHRRRAFPVTLP